MTATALARIVKTMDGARSCPARPIQWPPMIVIGGQSARATIPWRGHAPGITRSRSVFASRRWRIFARLKLKPRATVGKPDRVTGKVTAPIERRQDPNAGIRDVNFRPGHRRQLAFQDLRLADRMCFLIAVLPSCRLAVLPSCRLAAYRAARMPSTRRDADGSIRPATVETSTGSQSGPKPTGRMLAEAALRPKAPPDILGIEACQKQAHCHDRVKPAMISWPKLARIADRGIWRSSLHAGQGNGWQMARHSSTGGRPRLRSINKVALAQTGRKRRVTSCHPARP